MDRIVCWCTLALVVGACGQAGGDPADPATDDQFYALFFDEVLERGEAWWGYPAPVDYCVAIAPGEDDPSLDKSQDPSQAVLDSLESSNPDKAFHPVSSCSDSYPPRHPQDRLRVSCGLLRWKPRIGERCLADGLRRRI